MQTRTRSRTFVFHAQFSQTALPAFILKTPNLDSDIYAHFHMSLHGGARRYLLLSLAAIAHATLDLFEHLEPQNVWLFIAQPVIFLKMFEMSTTLRVNGKKLNIKCSKVI
jgi:hypothetical protein